MSGEQKRTGEPGIYPVHRGQAEYPKKLLEIYYPPDTLFVKGSLPPAGQKCVAVVGARGCSPYGETVAGYIGKYLAAHRVGVISGLAYGIDAAAHRGALEGQGATYAVMGCGADICYPAANRRLYEQILEKGGILSELVPGSPPKKQFFPMRNRIISGLSDAVIVVEARKKSGSLITADCALEQGKAVYAVPGRITDSLSYGTNWLISQGAAPLYDLEEFLKDLQLSGEKAAVQKNLMDYPLAKKERLVYSVLDLTPKHLETVIAETGLDFSDTLNAVYALTECGCVREIYKNHYVRAGL